MGTDAAEAVETLPSFKVHCAMCTELMKLVDRIIEIFPDLEAARPRCSLGIQSLCSLNSALEKAKLLLQHCRESSKLYLAITGDVIVSRCRRSRNLLEDSLRQIQNMVPVMLAFEISHIIDDLGAAIFVLDSSEEEAGKVVRELIQKDTSASDSIKYSEIGALKFAASRLQITTPKAILIEKRSIRKLLDKVGDSDPVRKKILRYLLHLLKMHGNLIIGEKTENSFFQHEEPIAFRSSSKDSVEMESRRGDGQCNYQLDELSKAIPPEEFMCPISLKLMCDPVVIASGQTFDRMSIKRWFDEGNVICPKTKMKLVHLSMTPNTAMKDLISKWCFKYRIAIDNPSMQPEPFHSLENSSSSIASFGSSMNDLRLPVDNSNISVGSLDTSCSEISEAYVTNTSSDITSVCLSRLADFCWESQCKVVKDLISHMKYDDQAFHYMSAEDFVEPLIKFLENAHDRCDVESGKTGLQLLLEIVNKNRMWMEYLPEDAFSLLTLFLHSELMEEALDVMEVLSALPYCQSKIVSSGAHASIIEILDSQMRGLQEQATKILQNLSSTSDICSQLISLGCIPKLVPFLLDSTLARHSISILRNLSNLEEGRVSIIETDGCLTSIAELLGSGSNEEQEHAVAVLLSLCSQRVQYCQLVMDEGIIPALVLTSVNGSEKGKVTALELLRLLRDIRYINEEKSFGSDCAVVEDATNLFVKKKSSSKALRFLRTKFSVFSKTSSQRSEGKSSDGSYCSESVW